MSKVALRGLFARKLRLALTVLAVVLGDGKIVHDGEAHSADDVLDLMKAVG